MECFYLWQNRFFFFYKKKKFYISYLVMLVAQLRAAAKESHGTRAGLEKSRCQTEIRLILNACVHHPPHVSFSKNGSSDLAQN